MKRSLILVSFLLCVFGCNGGRDVLVIRDVTVIDGTGAGAQAGTTVVVERGRISAVGDARTVRYPRSARVIDGSGKYLIPGLWDMHVHLGDTDGALPLFIVNGVTSVRDMGSQLEATVAMRDQIEIGAIVGPRIVTSGMMVESSSWVAQYVDLMREQGADVKVPGTALQNYGLRALRSRHRRGSLRWKQTQGRILDGLPLSAPTGSPHPVTF